MSWLLRFWEGWRWCRWVHGGGVDVSVVCATDQFIFGKFVGSD